MADDVALLKSLPPFRWVNPEEAKRLLDLARSEKKKKGEAIVEEGALGQALYVVKSGTVEVSRGGKKLGTLGVGEMFGEMSLVDDLFTSAKVAAAEEVELLVLPRHPFEMLVASDLQLAVKVYRAFCRTLSERLRKANSHLPSGEALKHGAN
jgi:CRP-like cAMP-binding protein